MTKADKIFWNESNMQYGTRRYLIRPQKTSIENLSKWHHSQTMRQPYWIPHRIWLLFWITSLSNHVLLLSMRFHCLTTFLDYITLKPADIPKEVWRSLTTFLDYITLKLLERTGPEIFRLTTFLDYITLKRLCWVRSHSQSLTTFLDYITLKRGRL